MAYHLFGTKPLSETRWLIANWTISNKCQWILYRNSTIFIKENAPENVVWWMAVIFFVNLNVLRINLTTYVFIEN